MIYDLEFILAYVESFDDYEEALELAIRKDRQAANVLLDSIFEVDNG